MTIYKTHFRELPSNSRRRLTRPPRKAGLLALLLLPLWNGASQAQDTGYFTSTPPAIDGFVRDPITGVVEDAYLLQGITYTLDSVDGDFAGLLYFAEDSNYLYFAFEQSVHLNDNSYGTNSVGWETRSKPHRLKDLLLSDHAKIELYNTSGALSLSFYLDYASESGSATNIVSFGPNGGDGSMVFGSAAHVTDYSSSLVWNFQDASPLWSDRLNNSPKRTPTNTYDFGTTADPAYPWIYEQVYEWQVSKAAFGSAGYGSLKISEVHNSPIKTGNSPIPRPALNGLKDANPITGSEVDFGESITYTLSFTNTGLAALSSVVITDVIDQNLTAVTPLDGGTCSDSDCGPGDTLTWNVGTLAIGATVEVQFQASVDWQGDVDAIYNTGKLTSSTLPTPFYTNTTEHLCLDVDGDGVCSTDNCLVDANPDQGDADGDGIGDACDLCPDDMDPDQGDGDSDGVGDVCDLCPVDYDPDQTDTNSNGIGDTCEVGTIGDFVWHDADEDGVQDAGEAGIPGVGVSLYSDPNGDGSASDGTLLAVQTTDSAGGYDFANVLMGSYVVTVTSPPSGYRLTTANTPLAVVQTPGQDYNNADFGYLLEIYDLAVEKSATGFTDTDGDGVLSPGDTVQYSIEYTNTGNSPLTTVSLADDLDELYVADAWGISDGGVFDGAGITWDLGTLAAGETGTVTYSVDLDDAGAFSHGSTLVNNTATLDSAETGPESSSDSVAVTAAAVLGIDKATTGYTDSDGDGTLSPGDTVKYAVTISNSGNADATGVVLTDDPDEGYVAGISGLSGGSYDGSLITWDVGALNAGSSATFTYSATLTAAGTFADGTTPVNNTATVDSGETAPATDSETVTVTAAAKLTIDKATTGYADTDGNGVLSPGDTVRYTVTIANTGNADASGVALTDDPDETYVASISAISGGGGYSGGILSWNVGALGTGDSQSYTYEATLGAAGTFADGDTAVLNTASVTSAEDGPATDTESVTVTAAANLTIDKATTGYADNDEDGVLSPGDTVHYSVTITNAGNAAATGVTLSDNPDEAYVSAITGVTGGGLYNGSTIDWSVGVLSAGASSTVTYTATLKGAGTFADGTTAVVNTATVDSGETDPATDGETVTVTAAAELTLAKTADGYYDDDLDGKLSPGDRVRYTLRYANVGNAPVTGVLLVDDPDETYVSGVGSISDLGIYDADIITWDIGSLAAGEIGEVEYIAQLGADGTFLDGDTTVVNLAEISSDQADPASDDASVVVSAAADLDIQKATTGYADVDGDGVLSPGDTVHYSVQVSNVGDAAANGVTVSDDPDETYVSGISLISGGGLYDGSTIDWSVGSLAAGASTTLTYSATLKGAGAFADGATAVNNTATVDSGETDPATDGETVTVSADAELTIAKSSTGYTDADGSGALSPGDTVQYSVTIANTGNAAANGVTLSDNPDETYVSAIGGISGGGLYNGSTIDWSVGALSAGASATYTYEAVLGGAGTFAHGPTLVLNTATVDSGETDPVTDGESVTVTAAAKLTIAKATTGYTDTDGNGVLSPGDTVNYAVTIGNVGDASATDVAVSDNPDEAYVSAIGSISGGGLYNGSTIDWSLGSLAAGASTTLTYSATLKGAGTFADGTTAVVNTATVDSGETDPATDGETVTVTAAAELTLAKTADGYIDVDGSGTLSPGDQVRYTLRYANVGNAPVTGVLLVDDPDETYVSGVGSISDLGIYDADIITWDIGGLAAGEIGEVGYIAQLGPDGTFLDGDTTVVNVADLSSDQTGTVTDDADVVVTAAADLVIAKATTGYTDADGNGTLSPGDTVNYAVTISNIGNATATNASVSDNPDETYVSAITTISHGGSYGSDTIGWTLGSVPAGTTATLTYSATLKGAGAFADGATPVANTATVDSNETDPTTDGETVTVDADAELTIAKATTGYTDTDDNGVLSPGDTVHYAVTISNVGNAPANNAAVSDNPDEVYVSSISAITGGGSYDGDVISWSLGTVSAGATSTLTYSATLKGAGAFADGATPVANTATVDSGETDPATDGETVTVTADAELTIAKATTGYTDTDGNGVLSPGDTVNYAIHYANTGNAAATDVALSDNPDETYVSSVTGISGGGSYDGDTIAWSIPTLAAGASGTVTYSVKLAAAGSFANGTTTVSNVAVIRSTEEDPTTDDEDVTVEAAPILAVAKSVAGTEAVSATVSNTAFVASAETSAAGSLVATTTITTSTRITYTIQVSNTGTAHASAVSIQDTLPAGVSFVSATGSYTLESGVVTWTVGALAVGASETVTLTVQTD